MISQNKDRHNPHRTAWTISIWVQDPQNQPHSWTGLLRTNAGQDWSFRSLSELNHLLCELGGWIDPPNGETSDPP